MFHHKVTRTFIVALAILAFQSTLLSMESCEQVNEESCVNELSADQLLALQVLRQLPEAELKKVLDLAREKAEVLPALHRAAKLGDSEKTSELATCNSFSEKTLFSQRTPLHFASASGKARVATLLLEKGADVHERDVYGMTSLHLAAEKGHKDTALVLIRFGACLIARDSLGRSPGELARKNGHTYTADLIEKPEINILRETGAFKQFVLDVPGISESGCCENAKRMQAVQSLKRFLLDGIDKDDFVTVVEEAQKLIFLFDSDVWSILLLEGLYEIYREVGCSKLFIATQLCKGRRLDSWIKRALETFSSAEKQRELNGCFFNRTPLLSAIENEALETVISLLCYGSDVNIQNGDGVTALMKAAQKGVPLPIFKFLCEKGACVETIDTKEFTALHYAVDEDNEEAAEFLIRESQKKNSVRELLELKDREHGRTPLLTAVLRCNPQMVKLLLEAGADPTAIAFDEWSALRLAISNCGPEGPSNLRKHAREFFLMWESTKDSSVAERCLRARIEEIFSLLLPQGTFHISERDRKFCMTWARLYKFPLEKWLK